MAIDVPRLMKKIENPPANHTPNVRVGAGMAVAEGAKLAYVIGQVDEVKRAIAQGQSV